MWTDPAEGRWVCTRCFESNEANADACAKCGLQRGADPAAAAGGADAAPPAEPGVEGTQAPPAQPWTAAQPAEPNRPGWLQLVLRFWWVGLLVIGGGIAAFNYLGGSRPVAEMGVGDCFDVADPESDTIDDVTLRECTEPHQYEMYFVGDMPNGAYPSDDDVRLWLDANCRPAFADYVGIEYEESVLVASFITPTEDGWNDGDHSVQCALYDQNDPELTESMKDAAR